MELIKPGSKIPFTRYRYIAIGISSVVNLLILVLLFTKGPLLGVDFAGGTVVELRFDHPIRADEVRARAEKAGLHDVSVQGIGSSSDNSFLLPRKV